MKQKTINNKGISPLIATVILIGFTVAIVALVILWGGRFVKEKADKEGALAEKQSQCVNVKFDVLKVCNRGGTKIVADLQNKGPTQIDGFIWRINGKSSSASKELHYILKPMDKVSGVEALYPADEIGTPQTVTMIPLLYVGGRKYVPCSGKLNVLEARVSAC